jgi:hypothetical protein
VEGHPIREIRQIRLQPIMKNVVSGGPTRAIAFDQANAGLPDTISLN